MPRIKYSEYRPNAEARQLIATCSEILDDYELLGYKLTLRQLYYQLVARDIIENSQKSYKRLGEIVRMPIAPIRLAVLPPMPGAS